MRQQPGAQHANCLHLFLANVGHHQFPRSLGFTFFVQADRERNLGQLGLGQAMQFFQRAAQLGVFAIVRVEEAERVLDTRKGPLVGCEVFLAVGQQVTALAALGLENALCQPHNGGAGRARLAQVVERPGRLPVRTLADEHHGKHGNTSQREHQGAAFCVIPQIHFQPPLQNVGSSSQRGRDTP